jgi:hypothetical protein
MAARLYIRFLMASKLVSDNATVKASGKELASKGYVQAFLKRIGKLDGSGGGVRSLFLFPSPSFLDHITGTELC